MYEFLNSWITSLFGVILIVAGLYTGITGKASWTESSIIILIGFKGLFSRDFNK